MSKVIELTNGEYNAIIESRSENLNNQILQEDSLGQVLGELIKDTILNALKGIGLFILANLILAAILIIGGHISVKQRTKDTKDMKQFLENNSKVRQYLNMILNNLKKFLILNMPSKYKKYIKYKNNLEIINYLDKKYYNTRYYKDKDSDKFYISIAKIDNRSLLEDIYKINLKDEFNKVYHDNEYIGDHYLNEDKYPKYQKAIEEIHDWLDDINNKTKQYKNCMIKFIYEEYYTLNPDSENDYIVAYLNIKDIENIHLSEEEKNIIEKLK